MVKPEIGLSSLFCLGEPFKKMTRHLINAETAYIEIVDDGFHSLNKYRVSVLKNIGKSYGLKYSVHAPFADINIASSSNTLLKAMLRRLEKSIAFAADLNAYMWVFHPGLKTGISMFYPNADWLQNRKTARLLLKIANDYSVKIGIENVPEPYPFVMKNVEDFTKFYSEMNEDLGLVLDVGHANINGQTELFLTTFANKIVHVHAHDNDGKEDQHLGIGYGTVDWKNFADALHRIAYNKVVVIESVERITESISKLKQLLS
jgi:sugar phosphate isomerase/epimerase